jgi:hypothetical protein
MSKLPIQSLILALLILTSCKKSSNSSTTPAGGTITATVDGTPMTFNNVLVAKDTAYLGAYLITFSGVTSLTASSPELSLTIDGSSAITTGTYSLTSTVNTTNLPAITFSQGSSLVYSSDISGVDPTTIVITTLSNTNIQGTFSGTLLLAVGAGAATKAITDGKFNVNFK